MSDKHWWIVIWVSAGLVVLCMIGSFSIVLISETETETESDYAPRFQNEESEQPNINPKTEKEKDGDPSTALLEVPDDLVGRNAAVVRDQLERIGFTNIQFGNADGTWVFAPENWVVQSVEPGSGSKLESDSMIVLTCVRSDEYEG